MKKKLALLLVLTLDLTSFKIEAATYNFNFYNNDKDEKQAPLAPTLAAPPAPVIPLAPLSSTEVTATKEEEENMISLGLLYYIRNDEVQNNTTNQDISGYGLKISTGKKGGLKLEAEILREQSQLGGRGANSYGPAIWDDIIAYGGGLNIKKEFMINNALGFEFGVGGNYLKGQSGNIEYYEVNNHSVLNSSSSDKNNNTAFASQSGTQGNFKIKTDQYSYYASLGLNLYLKQFALGISSKWGQTSTIINYGDGEKIKITSLAPTILAGLSYSF